MNKLYQGQALKKQQLPWPDFSEAVTEAAAAMALVVAMIAVYVIIACV